MNKLATLFSKWGLIRTFEMPDNCPDCLRFDYEGNVGVKIRDTYARCVRSWEKQATLRLWFLIGFLGFIASLILIGLIAGNEPPTSPRGTKFLLSVFVVTITSLVLIFWHIHIFAKNDPDEKDNNILKSFSGDIVAIEKLLGISLTKTSDCFTLEFKSRQVLNDLAFDFVSSAPTMQSLSRMEFSQAFATLKCFGLTDSKWDAYMDYAEYKHFAWFYEI